MRFDFTARPATFIERPNRYLVRVLLDGAPIEAHCPDPGRLLELLIPGVTVWVSPAALRPAPAPLRRTAWDLRFVEHPQGGQLISLDTRFPNRLFEEGVRAGFFPHFGELTLVAREIPLPVGRSTAPHSRIDFCLHNRAGQTWWVEVKSVTLVEQGLALFPDAVTERGRRHLSELGAMAAQGLNCAVAFVVQRPDARAVRAHHATDPAFAAALDSARAAGLLALACTCRLTPTEIALDQLIPVLASEPP